MFDFENNLTVDDIKVVPEAAQPLYEEKDGKFVLSDRYKPFATAYQGQTKALEKARKDLSTANAESASRRVTKNAVSEFAKGLGIETIDEENPLTSIDGHVKKLIEDSKKGKDITVNLDKIRAESEKRIGEVNTAAEGKIGKMRTSLEKYLVSQAATTALAAAKGNIELLLDKVQKASKVVEEGDDYVVRIVDDSGEVRSNGAGGYMTIGEYVAELKTKPAYAIAFASEASGGTGHKPGSSQQQQQQQQKGELSATDKITLGLKEQRRA